MTFRCLVLKGRDGQILSGPMPNCRPKLRPLFISRCGKLAQHAAGLCLRITEHLQHQMPLLQSLRMDAVGHVEECLYANIDGFGEVAADFLAFMPAHSAQVCGCQQLLP